MSKFYKIEAELDIEEVNSMRRWLYTKTTMMNLFIALGDIIKEAERKVVVIGDIKYYEDELQTALANINPIQ